MLTLSTDNDRLIFRDYYRFFFGSSCLVYVCTCRQTLRKDFIYISLSTTTVNILLDYNGKRALWSSRRRPRRAVAVSFAEQQQLIR